VKNVDFEAHEKAVQDRSRFAVGLAIIIAGILFFAQINADNLAQKDIADITITSRTQTHITLKVSVGLESQFYICDLTDNTTEVQCDPQR
jgi:hypothetical protein